MQVEGCGHLCGLQARRTLLRTLMGVESSCFNIYGEPPSQVSFPKNPNVPPRNKRETWLCCQFGRSFSNHSLASSGLSGCSMTDALRSRTKIGDRRKRPCSADVVLDQQPFSSNPGPSNGGVRTCIAGVRVLTTATFEGSGFLGALHMWKVGRRLGHQFFQVEVPFGPSMVPNSSKSLMY